METRPDPDRTTPPATDAEPLTDEQLGSLVRRVAADWTMPPRSLHEVPWHDRVGATPGRARRGVAAWLGGLGARLAAAATFAVIGVVALSLLAVWLRAPSAAPGPAGASGSPHAGGVGGSPSPVASGPSASTRPGGSPSATPPWSDPGTPPPIVGALMPGRSLALIGLEGARPLDLGTGRLGPYVAGDAGSGETMLVTPDGTIVCVCRPAGAGPAAGATSRARGLVVRQSAPDGAPIRETELPDLVARWAVGPTPPTDGTELWSTSGDLTPDGATLFVGWSVRSGDHWEVGIHVIDLASGARTQTLTLPDVPLPAGGAGAIFLVDAPRVVSSPDGTRLAIRLWSATDLDIDPLRRWSAVFLEGRIGLVEPLGAGPGTLADPSCSWATDEGFATAESYYALCMPNDYDLSELVFRRVRLDGAPLGDTPISEIAPNGLATGGFVVDRAAGAWYAWSPFGRMMAKVSLATGEILQLRHLPLATSAPTGGWLDGLGRSIGGWLAPSTMAKTEMAPALGISPDGTRLYALAVFDESPGGPERVPPAGILVVDAGTLEVLGQWQPTADYASLAVSADGQWVYALGMPGIDAKGQPSATTSSSLTVHRATDGAIRLRLEGFGRSVYSFPSPVMP